ncbi:FAD-dependent monooxygenase [Hydrogenophaga laconesensis]|uniref:2-polyprenyl-6-methoxyphenol hydroxylase-like FAD-dependent oxidoreductase n=1 Tax=Hydrogenophaga laconesensis TaxID=1805971 RepID=A0ABU1V7Q7_9BURK|nr:FAD-dependent monooxygenase [Hydrogenophaga laconesensis]MDR7093474.1 2-polyprenyl-6-methoxyphenol hydroxylase-like FAD-dependent oxidoreductase [Hydrogenophaga laconesensis]
MADSLTLEQAQAEGRELQVDVLVAGAGPCGLMLANELGLRNVPCLLVDPKATTAFNPQANATQARTMEHFRRIGIARQVRALGLPGDHPTDIAYFTRFARHELARLRLPTAAQATEQIKTMTGSWSAAELPHRVSQKFVEAVLREHAELRTGQRIRFGWRLQSFEDTGDEVVAQVVPVVGGNAVTVRARYLVGADGARSGVRNALGIDMGGATGLQRQFMGGKMFAIYLRAPAFYERFPHDIAWMYVSVNHERRVFMASVDGQGEFAFHAAVHPHETPEDWTHEDARRIFAEASGMDIDIEILSTGVWIAGHSLVAERYQHGRVFIAGDAAHLFTPTGGLGYNTAVGDAVNLGWKLAAVLKGQATPALLDTYEQERRPIGLRNTAYAREFADSVGLFEVTPALEADDAIGAQLRVQASEVLGAHVRREFNIPGVTFGERVDASPIVFGDPALAPEDQANAYLPSTQPGGRLPHRWLAGGLSLYDRLGFEWTVLAPLHAVAEAGRMAEAGHAAGLDVTVVTLAADEADGLLDDGLLLVRPDQLIAWRGTDAADAAAVWARVARCR